MEASSGSRGLCRNAWGQTINGDKNERTDKTNKDRHGEANNDENTNCIIIIKQIITKIIRNREITKRRLLTTKQKKNESEKANYVKYWESAF